MGKVRLADIAERTGVSTVTVHNALSGNKGVSDELREKNIHVPEDVSVVGFDNYLYPGLADCKITTYEVNIRAMTKVAIEKVLKQIKNPKSRHGLDIVSGKMVIKYSVKLKEK